MLNFDLNNFLKNFEIKKFISRDLFLGESINYKLVPRTSSFTPISKINGEKINYILSIIHNTTYSNNKQIVDGWVPLNFKMVEKIVGRNILGFLLDLNIIEKNIDRKYIPGIRCQEYRLVKFLDNNNELIHIGKGSTRVKDNRYMKKWKSNLLSELSIDEKEIIDLTLRSLNRITIDPSYIHELELLDGHQYDTAFQQIERIKNKDFHVVFDDRKSRVYHTISNLPKRFRKYLLLDGERMVELDLPNSQWAILALIIQFYYSNLLKLEDISRFVKVCKTGNWKDYMKSQIQIKEGKILNETEIGWMKEGLFIYLMGKNRWALKSCLETDKTEEYNKMKEDFIKIAVDKFKQAFPNVDEFIKEKKVGNHKRMSWKLQMIEASIIIKKYQYTLMKNGEYVISIHDSLLMKESKAAALEAIKEDLERSYGYTGIKIKYISKSSCSSNNNRNKFINNILIYECNKNKIDNLINGYEYKEKSLDDILSKKELDLPPEILKMMELKKKYQN